LKHLEDEKAPDETIEKAKVAFAIAQSKYDHAREKLRTLKRLAGQ